MAFARNQLPGPKVVDVGTDGDDLSDELMANRHRYCDRLASPVIPIEDMNIGAANPRPQNTNQDVIDANGRFWNVL